jgi:hypothetical protein
MLQKFNQIYIPSYMGRTETAVLDWHIDFADKMQPLHAQYGIATAAFGQYGAAVDLAVRIHHYRRNDRDYGKQLTNDFLSLLGQPGEVRVDPAPAAQLGPVSSATASGGFVQLVHNDWLPRKLRPSDLFTRDQQDYLGFIATPRSPVDWLTATPTFTALSTNSGILIRWKRHGADGLLLEVDRHDDRGWVRLRELSLTKWYDPTPLPAVATDWHYRATFLKADRPVGQRSLVVKVLVQG